MQARLNGSLANETLSTTSADGNTVTIQRDTTGNGVIDSIETITVSSTASGTTKTVTDYDGTGTHVLDSTVRRPAPTVMFKTQVAR